MKKKLLALALAMTTALLVACGGGKAYTPGTYTDAGYESEYLGFKFTTPEGFVLSTQEEIVATMGESMDLLSADLSEAQKKYAEIAIIYEMMVANESGTANANIVLEKTNVSVDKYIEAFLAQVTELSGADITVDEGREKVTIAGAEYTKLTGTFTMYEIPVSQEYYIRKVNDRMMCMTVTYFEDVAARDALINGFAAY